MEECQKLFFQVSNISKQKLSHIRIGCVLAPPHFENRVAGPGILLDYAVFRTTFQHNRGFEGT